MFWAIHILATTHAIARLRAPKTMQVGGSLQSKSVTVLIDSGNTYNFISESAARRVGLQPKTEGKMEVMVASGEKLNCPDKCSNVQLKLQRIPIVAEFFILPLEGYDIVMGTQWLQTLGPIQWDFSKLYMTFCLNGRKVTLQGLNNSKNRMINSLKLRKLDKKVGGRNARIWNHLTQQ
ncbi:hypothetical protein ACOSP7_015317 [Xanthoceras sorbifolium]